MLPARAVSRAARPRCQPPGSSKPSPPRTLSIVEWAPPAWPPDTWITSPDLSPLLRELLDAHGGLQAGAHLQLWLRAPEIYTENAELAFEDLDAEGGRAAVLTLRWSALP